MADELPIVIDAQGNEVPSPDGVHDVDGNVIPKAGEPEPMLKEVLPIPGVDQVAQFEVRVSELEKYVAHLLAGLAHILPPMKD